MKITTELEHSDVAFLGFDGQVYRARVERVRRSIATITYTVWTAGRERTVSAYISDPARLQPLADNNPIAEVRAIAGGAAGARGRAVRAHRRSRAPRDEAGVVVLMVGVWVRLQDGQPWCCEEHRHVGAALARARIVKSRTVIGDLPFLPDRHVWIAPPPTVGLNPALARFRRPQVPDMADPQIGLFS